MRGRKLNLPLAINEYDFAALARQEKHGKTKLRLLGMAHLQEGKSYAEVAKMLKVSWIAVRNWLRRFTQGGLAGLKEQARSGRKSLLAVHQIEAFKQAIEHLQGQRAGGRIRGEDIQQLLEEQFNAKYALDSVYKVLQRVDMVWITARSKHPKVNTVAQEAFKKTLNRKWQTSFQAIFR